MPEPAGRDVPHRHRARIARLPVVGAVAALLVVGLVLGRADTGRAGPVTAPQGMPTAAPASALSSSWFCAGATGTARSAAPGTVVVTNAGTRTVDARLTLLGAGGTHPVSRVETVTVGPDSRRDVPETTGTPAPWVGAVVALDGGAVSVEQQVTGPLGTSATPCATAGSASWYFATGATLINASSEITLLDPYPTPAIVNLSFTTNEGQEAPAQFSGIIVPPGQLVAVDLGAGLRRRSAIATSVTTSDGRVVAWKTDIVSVPVAGTPILGTRAAVAPDADPASPVLGVTDVLGAPAAMTSWSWPEGSTAAGVGEQYAVYNPGNRTADLALSFDLGTSAATAEPLDLTVGPQETTVITSGAEARIPSGSTYATTLRSTNGVPVVAERTVAQTAPQTARGTGEMFGATMAARSWLIGAGEVTRRTDETITVADPAAAGARPVTFTLRELAGGRLAPLVARGAHGRTTTVGTVTVTAGGRVTLDLGRVGDLDAALLVTASGPVVVERDLLGRDGSHGVSISLAVPLAG